MFGKNFFPYTSLQELNLDWILTKVKNILRFVPDDGAVGQILRRTRDGAEWSDEQGGGGGAVNSVNGQTGDVVLDAADVGALPDTYTPTFPVTSVNSKTGAVVLDKTDIGLGNVANVAQYSASNPPPYPVASVNSQTGDVVLDASDVGALPDSTTIPSATSDLTNDSGFITSAQAPVQSVNGQTGNVVIPTSEWTQIGTASGSTAISISNQYKTFSIDAQYGTSSVFFPLFVAYSQLGTTAKLFTVGYYINASTNGFCQFSVSDLQVSILALYINGVNYTSTATLRVFGQ